MVIMVGMVGMVGQTLGHYRIVEKIGLAGGRDLYSSSRRGALMNVRTALISSALLLAVVGWACEQGPASPSALGTPGGGSLGAAGGVSLDAAGGVRLASCKKEPDQPKCNGGGDGGGGGKKTFEAIFTTGALHDTGFLDTNTVTTVRFPVDNKCNSVNSIDLRNSITRNGIELTQSTLAVKRCRTNYGVTVKVWVGDDDGTNRFATDYLPARVGPQSPDTVRLHVHAENADFVSTSGTDAFTLNIGDIVFIPAP